MAKRRIKELLGSKFWVFCETVHRLMVIRFIVGYMVRIERERLVCNSRDKSKGRRKRYSIPQLGKSLLWKWAVFEASIEEKKMEQIYTVYDVKRKCIIIFWWNKKLRNCCLIKLDWNIPQNKAIDQIIEMKSIKWSRQ